MRNPNADPLEMKAHFVAWKMALVLAICSVLSSCAPPTAEATLEPTQPFMAARLAEVLMGE